MEGGAARGAPGDTVVRLALMLSDFSGSDGASLFSVASSRPEARQAQKQEV